MKRNNILITCLILFGSAFVALQVNWQLFAKAQSVKRDSLIGAINKRDFALSPEGPMYMGDLDLRKRLGVPDEHMLTEQQYNTHFTADERYAFEQAYAQSTDLKFGDTLTPTGVKRGSIVGPDQKQGIVSGMRPPARLSQQFHRPVNELPKGRPVALDSKHQGQPSPEPLYEAGKDGFMVSEDEMSSTLEPSNVGIVLPPLPLRPGQIVPLDEENGIIPPAPQLPLMPQVADESMMTQQNDLLEQIRTGKQLNPVKKEERQPTLQDEIREGIQLRPVSDRELPEREKEVTLQDEVKQGVVLKPAGERVLAERPAKPLTVLDEIRQFDKSELKPLSEQTEQFEPEATSTIPLAPLLPPRQQPVGLSEQDALKKALQEKFSSSEDDEEEGMTPEEMGFIPPAPSMDGMIQPEPRPEANKGLLKQIREGKQLKPVPESSKPTPEAQDSVQKSLEKMILQYQQTAPETDQSEDTESDWE